MRKVIVWLICLIIIFLLVKTDIFVRMYDICKGVTQTNEQKQHNMEVLLNTPIKDLGDSIRVIINQ